MKGSRILLADDHTLLLEAFQRMLEPSFEVIGTCSDGRELIETAVRLEPDAIVLDIGMPMSNGLEAGRRLKQLLPDVRLIYLTGNQDPDLAAEAFRLGASAFLLKTSAGSELVRAIHGSLRGRTYATPAIASALEESFIRNGTRPARASKLTPRQREVLQLLAEGRSMKEVAAVLNITPRTVAFHKYAMMDELHIRSSAELVQFAMKTSVVFA